MVMRVLPEKKYRLHDGSLGTEFEAITQAIKVLEAQKRAIEEKIEIARLRLEVAER